MTAASKVGPRERSIILTPEEAAGLQRGTVTQLWRMIRNPNEYGCLTGDCPHEKQAECDEWLRTQCPFGSPGDRLACRETWANMALDGYPQCIAYKADPDDKPGWGIPPGVRWRSPATMPRWAVRTVLEILEVQPRQLQSVTDAEAIASGAETVAAYFQLTQGGLWWWGEQCLTDERNPAFDPTKAVNGARGAFAMRWDSRHKPGERWADNRWCWWLKVRICRSSGT